MWERGGEAAALSEGHEFLIALSMIHRKLSRIIVIEKSHWGGGDRDSSCYSLCI
jgi:hypothetical protein